MIHAVFGIAAAVAVGWPTPVRLADDGTASLRIHRFRVRLVPALVGHPGLCAEVLETLRTDLESFEQVVPEPAMELLRERVTIWIEVRGAQIPGVMNGRGMVYHPSAHWLKDNGLDPRRAGGIEIVRARDYLDWRGEVQPMMVLHELAHAYHHLLGFDDPEITRAFEAAKASGRYDRVGYVLDQDGETHEAYAMQNALEYFSELSEAYFGRNDFEPFDREGLREFDPVGFGVVERAWRMDAGELRQRTGPAGDSPEPE